MRIVVVGCFVLLGLRLVSLQLSSGGRSYRALGAEETTVSVVEPVPRGAIYDRDGATLALSVPVDQVVADPLLLKDPARAAASLAPALGTSADQLLPLLSEHTGYVVLTSTLPTAKAAAVERLGVPGVTLSPTFERIYPDGSLLSPVLGGVDAAGKGDGGLEYEYQSVLASHPGERVEAVAPSGVPIAGTVRTVTAARPGSSLELTIDQPLELVVHQLLSAGVAASKAENGMAIVMDPRTGAILAMASVVRNAATGAVTAAATNLPVDDVYEPGSVFKLVTFSAALQDGIITPDTVVQVPSVLPIDGAIFHDAEAHPAEPLTATQILAQSSNMGTILIAERLGAERLANQISLLGFGHPTGLHFPGASPGIVKPVSTWSPTAIGSTPIGQDTGVTPLQVLDVFNTVANGGVMETPRLVRAVIGPGGHLHPVRPKPGRRLIAASADAELAHMMESVVTVQGTAPGAAVPGYTVAGKTGTSQIPSPSGGYIPGAYWATFAGFAPEENPALSAIVVLTRPDSEYGGAAAAPIFSQIMQYALHRYDVPASPDGGVQPLPPQPGAVAGAG
jgi:cell division protein FtsI (penicillin-binding protein 3)